MRRIVFRVLVLLEISHVYIANADSDVYSHFESKNSDILSEIVDENLTFMPMLETLHLFSRKPSCFRSSISSLISMCEKLDSDLHENEKLAFAVKLTLCELDTARVEVPKICRQEDFKQCVKELEMRPQWWTSYSGYFRDVTRMCFFARTEVEKDQLLALHRNLTYAQMGLLRNLKLEMDDIDLRMYEKYKMERLWQQFQEDMENGMLLMRNEIKEMEKMANVLLSSFYTSINVSLEEINKKINSVTTNLDNVVSKIEKAGSHAEERIKGFSSFTNELLTTTGNVVSKNFQVIKEINNKLANIEDIVTDLIVKKLNKISLSLDLSFGSAETLSDKILSMSMVIGDLSKTLKNLTFSHNDLFSSLSSIEALQLKVGNGSLSTIKSISNLVNERMDNLLGQIHELKDATKNAENHIYSWIFSKIPFAFTYLIFFLFFPMYKFSGICLIVFLYYLWKKVLVFVNHLNILNISSLLYIPNIYKNITYFSFFSIFIVFFVYFFRKNYKNYNHQMPLFYRLYLKQFKIGQNTNYQRLSINKSEKVTRIF